MLIFHYGRQDYSLVFGFLPLFTCVFLLCILNLVDSCLSFLVKSLILTLVLLHFDGRFQNFSVHFLSFLTFALFFFCDTFFFISFILFLLFFWFFITVYAFLSIIFYIFYLCLFDFLIFFDVCGVFFIVFWCL